MSKYILSIFTFHLNECVLFLLSTKMGGGPKKRFGLGETKRVTMHSSGVEEFHPERGKISESGKNNHK